MIDTGHFHREPDAGEPNERIGMSKFGKDWLERVSWTAAQAGVGVFAVEVADLDVWWAVGAAAVLAGLKGWVAKHVGNPDSASTVKSV